MVPKGIVNFPQCVGILPFITFVELLLQSTEEFFNIFKALHLSVTKLLWGTPVAIYVIILFYVLLQVHSFVLDWCCLK